MISGFARFSDGTVERIESTDHLAAAWAKEDAVVWVDYLEPTEADLRALKDVLGLDDASIDDCLYGEQRSRIDEFDTYMFIVLYGLVGLEDPEEFDPRKLAIFFGSRFLITVHRESLKTIHTVLERCNRGTATARSGLSRGVDQLLHMIIDGMVDKYVFIADKYEAQIETLEEASLDPSADEQVLVDSAGLRRELLRLRSLAVSQREALTPIVKGEYDYISESLEQQFSHVRDHLTQVIELVDTLREHLHGVRDNYHTALANRTNAIMKTLTIFATILLPLTFIAGVYGMNLPLWPPPDQPFSFWVVMGVMLVLGVSLLLYFQRKRWL
jgi:magnesium transporter